MYVRHLINAPFLTASRCYRAARKEGVKSRGELGQTAMAKSRRTDDNGATMAWTRFGEKRISPLRCALVEMTGTWACEKKNRQRQKQRQMRGFFAPLRMTSVG